MAGLHWSYLVLILPLLFFISFILWLEYKRAKEIKEKERRIDPFMRGLITSFFVVLLMLTVEMFGGWEKGTTTKYWWVSLLFLIGVTGFYLALIKIRMPLNLYKQFSLAQQTTIDFFKARGYKGNVSFLPFDAYRTTKEAGRDNVGNLLFTVKGSEKLSFYFQVDKITREILTIMPNPSTAIKNRLLEKVLPKQRDILAEEFGEEIKTKEEK